MDRVLNMLAFEPDTVKFTVPTLLLFGELLSLAEEIQRLKGRFEVIQILRAFVVAHIFRLPQLYLRNNKLPSFSYMGKVFLLYHIPITVVVGALYTLTHLFPSSSSLVVLAQANLLFITLLIPKVKRGMALKQDSSNTSLVLHQHNYDAANNNSMIINTIMGTMDLTMDLQVTDHFITTLLAGLCVDLTVQLERLEGDFEYPYVISLLVLKHIPCFTHFALGKNKVPPVYYLRNVILIYDIPVTITIAVFYIISTTPSKTLLYVIFLELCLLFVINRFKPERGELNQAMGLQLEQDINPNQASSSNTESVHHQSHDAGFASGHDAFKRLEDVADASSISDTNNTRRWIHKDYIGSGGFGTVFVAENRETKAIGAVKVLKDYHPPEIVTSIEQEIEFLRQLKHPNIVKYIDHEIVGREIYLYMELIRPGSLVKYISERGALPKSLVRNFSAQILSGLVYLHSKRIVHRDIKPGNILVGPNDTVKLADFGVAKHLNNSVGKHTKWGTYPYAAPEAFRRKKYSCSLEANAADIWSVGYVIIEMFIGQTADPDSETDLPNIPEELCPEVKDFLKCCLKVNPKERASAEKLLGHPFIIGTN